MSNPILSKFEGGQADDPRCDAAQSREASEHGGGTPVVENRIRVFLVEDDADLRDELEFGLTAQAFEVVGFPGSRELYRALLRQQCDVVVIDVGLPGEDGFSIATTLESLPGIGVVFLTARTSIEDRVRGLTVGGDAYLLKPVDLRELAATIRSVYRRTRVSTPEPAPQSIPPTVVDMPSSRPAEWVLSADAWTLTHADGFSVSLTSSERLLLAHLFAHRDQVVTRDALIEVLGHRADYYLNHRLDMVVSRLRAKVSKRSGKALPLRVVRGIGFILSI